MYQNLFNHARLGASTMRLLSHEKRNLALSLIAKALKAREKEILAANQQDLVQATHLSYPTAFLDRLLLDEKRLQKCVDDLNNLITLPDPLGVILWETIRPNGLMIKRVSIPLGLIGIVYEARPNVTIDIIALAIKTGNACILRGGNEATQSNLALMRVILGAIKDICPMEAIVYLNDPDRSGFNALLQAQGVVDCIIPRGGKGLIDAVLRNSRVPVIETGAGNCHLYVDCDASIDMVMNIARNAKMSRPSVCNAVETILVHEQMAPVVLPALMTCFEGKVEIRGCEETQRIIRCEAATDEDFFTEFNDNIVAIKVVKDLTEAINHINHYSTHHSEAIITLNQDHATRFFQEVDSACVYHNASTRFSDGGEFGFGAEVGISTQKMPPRGPMGLEALTTYQYQIHGGGQIR
ncbi:MAG: glutamate-5-semialdehyde dehydrogenase [Bacilli bacterium]